jgi:hypothetical protein
MEAPALMLFAFALNLQIAVMHPVMQAAGGLGDVESDCGQHEGGGLPNG